MKATEANLLEFLKKTPLTLKHLEDFFSLLPARADSPLSWTVDMDERKRLGPQHE